MHNENYVRFEDPGHSWLRVPLQDIADLGLANKISRCSYVKGPYAYLEEDCDAPVFIAAFIELHGYEPLNTSRYIDDPYSKDNPRNFRSYPAQDNRDNGAWKKAIDFIMEFRRKQDNATNV